MCMISPLAQQFISEVNTKENYVCKSTIRYMQRCAQQLYLEQLEIIQMSICRHLAPEEEGWVRDCTGEGRRGDRKGYKRVSSVLAIF